MRKTFASEAVRTVPTSCSSACLRLKDERERTADKAKMETEREINLNCNSASETEDTRVVIRVSDESKTSLTSN